MALTQEQVKLLKGKLIQKCQTNKELMTELKITSQSEIASTIQGWDDTKLAQHINPRILGMIGVSKKDLGMI